MREQTVTVGTFDVIESARDMTLRDYFAAHAPERGLSDFDMFIGDRKLTHAELEAAWRYAYADAMIAERSK